MSDFTAKQLEDTEKKIIFNLKQIYDPEIPVNIYDLGLIYDIKLKEENSYLQTVITMTLTSPTCPVAGSLVEQVKTTTQSIDLIDEADVHLVFNPPWTRDMISKEGQEHLMMNGSVI